MLKKIKHEWYEDVYIEPSADISSLIDEDNIIDFKSELKKFENLVNNEDKKLYNSAIFCVKFTFLLVG